MKILIIGAGPIGSILANCLADHGLDVLIFDKVGPTAAIDDGRTSAISRGSFNFLTSIGLGAIFQNAAPINQIRVSDHNSHNFVHFEDNAPMGYIIKNQEFRQFLYEQINSKPNIKWLDQTTQQHDLCIAADGRNSETRDKAGIRTQTWDYEQTAFVSVVEHSLPHNNIAFEHFTPTGPLAFLPMAGNCSSLVWSANNKTARDLERLSAQDFCQALQSRFEFLGDLQLTKLWKYPLSAQYAEKYFAERLALVGDAAHAIHPVAGQGLNLGIRDCQALNDLVREQMNLGLDIGSQIMLEKYQKQRMFDNAVMLGLTDALVKGYSNSNPLLRFLRQGVMSVANSVSPLKEFMVKHATGTL